MLNKIKTSLISLCRKAEDSLVRTWEPELKKAIDDFNARPIRNYYDTRAYLEKRIEQAQRLRSIRLTRWLSRNLQEVEECWEELAQRIDREFKGSI